MSKKWRDIWFERRGYDVFFVCLNDLFFLIFLLLLLSFYLILYFLKSINSLNYYISTTSFIMHLCISLFLLHIMCMCVYGFISFVINIFFSTFSLCLCLFSFTFLKNIKFFFFKWLKRCPWLVLLVLHFEKYVQILM